jgi:hypothetical protein
MANEPVEIPVSDLLLDVKNPRLQGDSLTQQAAALELATQEGDHLVALADDIVESGLDPSNALLVVPTHDQRKRYVVQEGNRRVLALRALETPSLVSPALSNGASRRLTQLAARYEKNPVSWVRCVLFDDPDDPELLHWIHLRHTGLNQGAGLHSWGSIEQDRFRERHAGGRSPARQLIEFVEKRGELSAEAEESSRRILTNVERLVETTAVRESLGIDIVDGQLVALYPAEEIVKGLTRVVDDLKTGRVTVPKLYHAADRRKYVGEFPRSARPRKSRRLAEPVVIDDLAAGRRRPRAVTLKPRRKAPHVSRTTVIPKGTQLDVTHPRINAVYNELLNLNGEQFPNACSVLLRVFVEMSVDHYLTTRELSTTDTFAKRLRSAGSDLEKQGLIPHKLKTAIDTLANSKNTLGPTLHTLHQYVHNEYVFPKPSELYSTWDEIEPWVTQLWPEQP